MASWLRLIAVRIVGAAFTLLVLATVIFFLLKLVPGDEAVVAAGPGASDEQIEAQRELLGLNAPLPVQLGKYLERLLHGNLGISNSTHGPVASSIVAVLPQTAEIVVFALLLTIVIAIPLATLSAFRSTGALDTARRILVIAIAGLPTFWLGLMLQHVLATGLHLLPVGGTLSHGYSIPRRTGAAFLDCVLAGNPAAAWDALQHLFLPVLVLAIPGMGYIYRLVRAELIRSLSLQHVSVGRAAGLPEFRVVSRHVVPHALGPAIILLGAEFGGLFGGAVLIESIFGIPGIGSLLQNAVAQKDTAMVEGGVLVIGVIVVISNFVADMIQLMRDPRIRANAERGMR